MLRQLQPQDPAFVPLELGKVSNPLARQWLQHLYKTAAPVLALGKEEYYPFMVEDSTLYRRWVRKKLREGEFFSRLSDGLNGLPDIREALTPLLRPLHRGFLTNDSKWMIEHVVRNLEWYLDPTQSPKFSFQPWIVVFWLGFFAFLITGVVQLTPLFPLGGPVTSLLLISIGFSAFGCLSSFLRGATIGESPGSWKYQVNSVELYRYLLELHSDEVTSELDGEPLRP